MLMTNTWRGAFPVLAGISDEVSCLLDKRAQRILVNSGTLMFGPSNPAENLLLLVSGIVRVQKMSEAGREFLLYRVHAGDSCAMTAACLLAFEDYSANGIAETDVEAIMIPREIFDELMSTSKEFRAFVFEAYSKRITDLFLEVRLRDPAALERLTHQC